MAPKPEPARLAYVFGMVLAVAAIILAITTPNLAASELDRCGKANLRLDASSLQ
jgi:hypothetical protein